MFIRILWLIMVGVMLAGCDSKNGDEVMSAGASSSTGHLDHAQPRLRTIKLWLGSEELITEVAVEPVELQTGMMFRKEMSENEAMLFVFGVPHRASFYMKNTYIPLSIAYIDRDGVIKEIYDLTPLNETPVQSKFNDIQYALEVKQGWFRRHNITMGAVVRTEKGSLYETFFSGKDWRK